MSSPASPSHQENPSSSQQSRRRAIADVISESYAPFDHRSTVVEPFDSESKRDVEFLEKLNLMVLELMLDFHAWSTARPAHESDTTADALEKEVKTVIEFEREQGMSSFIEKTRQRLNEFVTRIKLALAALTGLSG